MGFWIRFAALIIDGIIYGIALYVWVLLTLFVPILGILAIPVVIYAFYKEIKCQTVGKRLLGIKVVSESGQDISFWRGLLRESIGKFISGIIVYLGYIWVAFDSHKQGWHDKIADTYVIRR